MTAAGQRWKRRPEGSNWGDFGPDDRLGRLNLVTPERRRAGLAEAREGIAFCLSLPLDLGSGLSPRRRPPSIFAAEQGGRPVFNFPFCEQHAGLTDVVCDDGVHLYLQYSTQWDSFAHMGSLFDADGDGVPEPCYYNGFPPAEPGRSPLGLEHMAATGVQGRGVLIDLHRHFGDARTAVGYDALAAVMREDGVTVEEGDFVCVHTGFAQRLLEMGGAPDIERLRRTGAVLDSRDPKLLDWVRASGLAVLAADNHAVEERMAEPPPGYRGALLPLHELCLFKLGIHLGELWHLTPLANWLRDHGRSRFLLTAPPLRLPGAVGSPASPVATV
jgi:kynurenine formamidase